MKTIGALLLLLLALGCNTKESTTKALAEFGHVTSSQPTKLDLYHAWAKVKELPAVKRSQFYRLFKADVERALNAEHSDFALFMAGGWSTVINAEVLEPKADLAQCQYLLGSKARDNFHTLLKRRVPRMMLFEAWQSVAAFPGVQSSPSSPKLLKAMDSALIPERKADEEVNDAFASYWLAIVGGEMVKASNAAREQAKR